MSGTRESYERAIGLYNAGDVDGFADAHAEDAILVTPAGTMQGRAAIGHYWRNQRSAFPDLLLRLDVVVEQGDSIATEWTWAGTNTGPLTLRDGSRVRPTGRRVEIKGMELAHLHGRKIVVYHMYWDGMDLARQLGLVSEQALT